MSKILTAVPIVVYGEGEVIIDSLLGKRKGRDEKHTSERQQAFRTGLWGGRQTEEQVA